MPPRTLSLLALITLITAAPVLLFAQGDENISSPLPHPLAWWTHHPLRLDKEGFLLIGRSIVNGHIVTARDYRVKQKITHVGTLSGHRILQILTTIRPGPALIANGSEDAEDPPSQWKSLLMQTGSRERYVEIYRLQADSGLFQPLTDAATYGVGPDAILATYDGDSANGGGCADGYWWFDKAGTHLVDFSPLLQAISRALPKNSTYTPNCWALHPEKSTLRSWVQERDAKCHACGGLGMVESHYRIEHGVAIPISVLFKPNEQP